MNPTKNDTVDSADAKTAKPASNNTLTVTDNRTGKSYEVPIKNDTIKALDLRQIKADSADFGMMGYDPAFTNTASCTSRISYIDGRQRHPALPRLLHRRFGGAEHLS